MGLINLLLCILAVAQNSWAPFILMLVLSGEPMAILLGVGYLGHRLVAEIRGFFARRQERMRLELVASELQEQEPPWWHLQAPGDQQFLSPSLVAALNLKPRPGGDEAEDEDDLETVAGEEGEKEEEFDDRGLEEGRGLGSSATIS